MRWRLVAMAALLLGLAAPATAQPRVAAEVTIDRARAIGELRRDFLGFSFEQAALSNASLDPGEGNVATLLATLSPGGHLRFGGTLLDTESWWRIPGRTAPSWSRYIIDRARIDALARLARRTGWRVEAGINLGHFDADNAEDHARSVAAALGPSLAGFACGNEIDLFDGGTAWPDQRAAWERCAAIVSRHGPLLGGEEAEGLRPAMLADVGRRLSLATSHFYAQYDNCFPPPGHRRFTVGDLLSAETARRTAAQLAREVALARSAGLDYRVSESNTAACLKQEAIGDVYAAALWSVDYQLLAASLGVTGVNMHVPWEGWRLCSERITYAALCAPTPDDLARRRLVANPLYYGMLVVGSVGPGRMLATTVRAGANITAYTVAAADGALTLVVVHKDAPGGPMQNVLVHGVPAGLTGTSRTLSAPSLTARRDAIRFAGSTVQPDGTFSPGLPAPVTRTRDGHAIAVPTGSATIVRFDHGG